MARRLLVWSDPSEDSRTNAFAKGRIRSSPVTEHGRRQSVIPPKTRNRNMRPRPAVRTETPLLVCHSHLRWDWVYQRPQHLLSRLARHWPVIVEEEPLFDDRPPGLDVLMVAQGVTVIRPHRRAEKDFDLGALVEDYVAAVRGDR